MRYLVLAAIILSSCTTNNYYIIEDKVDSETDIKQMADSLHIDYNTIGTTTEGNE
jgi:hypothetical protein